MSENQALATTNGRAVVTLTDEDRKLFGLDTIDREDQMLPRVRLAQNTSRIEKANPGEFHNSLTGIVRKELTFVVLRVGKGRVMWPENYQAEQDPLCASDDGRKPREEHEGKYDALQGCAKCPMSQWAEDHTPPACSLAYNYLCVDTSDGMPFLASLSRTSAKAAKQLNTLFGIHTITHAIKATTEKVTKDQGVWFEWRISDAGKVDNPAAFLQMARNLAGRAITTDTGDEKVADDDGLEDGYGPMGEQPDSAGFAETEGELPF